MNTLFVHPRIGDKAAAFLSREHKLLIGGKWVPAQSGKVFDTHDPGTGRVIARVAEGDAADIDLAVKAARQAFEGGPWSRITPSDRGRLVWKLADLLEQHAEEFAELEALDNGKPLTTARRGDVPLSVDMFRYMAGWATKITGETLSISTPGNYHAFTVREPVGVVGQIIPWNAPLLMAAWKLAPALATGCTIVLKPAEQTPLTALRLGELIQEAGFPDGVVNIVTGFGPTAGAAIAGHPDIDKVAFTGSTEVGRHIVNAAMGNFKKVSLELGGKSPVIVFPDADMSVAVPGAAQAIFANSGQVCTAGSRLFVHKKAFDRMIDGLTQEAGKIRVGHGLAEGTQMGPVISEVQLERIAGYIDQGKAAGATIASGGKRVGSEGYFMAPTILTDTKPDMSVMQEEIFGPVVCAVSFDDDDLEQIAKQANDSIYGLAGSIWTRDLSTAHKMIRRIRAGRIGVNVHGSVDAAIPTGGFKQSGWGREKGHEGLHLYTEVKSVIISL
ncbi:aldehyde dehydrogenase family protein [Dongia soli]|uniref:Aldehyde dehydrogenase family protein n=1 Tax=Dongia soli TaxID=600628 RepID=A0ABU5EE36_9PROT|nr:aldehyde dehydrogenase family protein [Dongia soli]MDY0884325.1 aldehyde dehydrogenase family protein [Dongia soli]